jgi:predicted amidohydrolase
MAFRIAFIHDVFYDTDGGARLGALLGEAKGAGAQLALLPELPLNDWAPARRRRREEDAEEPEGPRHRRLAEAASTAGIALIGGAIVRDPESGRRFNRALLYDATGELLAAYDKCHLPSEEGFWESDHYEPGDEPARPIVGLEMVAGIQICSDSNRPEGSHLLGARGAEFIVCPRATPTASYARWLLVFRANALTSCAYVLSPNRPHGESGVEIGGPSVAVGPDGSVLLESTEPLAVVDLERDAVERARRDYPGYLSVRADLYARAWSEPS